MLRYNDRVRSAAADWSFYPVGTTFRIKGLPYLYVVDDYGSALLGTGTVDIYKPTKEIMNLWGRRTVELTVVQWGSFTRSAELLSQRTGYDHCRKMLANIIRQRPDMASVAKLLIAIFSQARSFTRPGFFIVIGSVQAASPPGTPPGTGKACG